MNDGIKDVVAQHVQAILEHDAFAVAFPDTVEKVVVTRTDALNTQIRVQLTNGMPRYFNVKVSEHY